MKPRIGVITFPGTCDDRDALRAVDLLRGEAVALWHADSDLEGCTGVIVPGGFSYGDYLRAGAIARFAPIMREVEAFATAGGPVLGICNGFQVLCEAGLLPGVLRPNHHGRFVCRDVDLRVERAGSPWLAGLQPGDLLRVPVKHHDGAWYAPPEEQERVEGARPGCAALCRQSERRARRRRLRHERRGQRVRAHAAPRARGRRGTRAAGRATAAGGPALAGPCAQAGTSRQRLTGVTRPKQSGPRPHRGAGRRRGVGRWPRDERGRRRLARTTVDRARDRLSRVSARRARRGRRSPRSAPRSSSERGCRRASP